jgi:blue copper oxidase
MGRRISRRSLLKAGLIGVPAATASLGGGLTAAWAAADTSTAGRLDFTNRLAIPPLAASRLDEAGRRVFDLRAAAGEHRFRPGPATATLGVDGGHLGPTLRASRGETVLMNVRNELSEATSLHWHGMRLPAAMDGGPHQVVEPGGVWSPTWRIDQPAATLWYHPHPHQRTARHVYRGMAGLFIVDDPAGPAGLPSRYGVDDIPVIVQDKRFGDDNRLDESAAFWSPIGILGDQICVNGTLAPYHEATTERVRLRLLNASNARVYRFGFADGRPFALIGTDGGLLAAPYETARIQLSPGERAEIVVSLRPGECAVLRSFPPDLGVNFWNARFSGGHDTFDILQLRAAAQLSPTPPPPGRLADLPDVEAGTPVRTFRLSGFSVNGEQMDMSRIDFAVTRGSTEVWEIVAIDEAPHNFHVHDAQFRVLSVGGAPPPPELCGWKDTVHTPPNTPVRISLRFGEHADPGTPYMYHCHLLYHEDQGLMGQFVVVEPGRQPSTPEERGHHE